MTLQDSIALNIYGATQGQVTVLVTNIQEVVIVKEKNNYILKVVLNSGRAYHIIDSLGNHTYNTLSKALIAKQELLDNIDEVSTCKLNIDTEDTGTRSDESVPSTKFFLDKLDEKIDSNPDKDLSTNNYTNEDKAKVERITLTGEQQRFLAGDGAYRKPLINWDTHVYNKPSLPDVAQLGLAIESKLAKKDPIQPGTKTKITYNENGLVVGGESLTKDDIPTLPASKITSGVLHRDRIPGLPASKITSGVFSESQIPELPASKITDGVLDSSVVPNIGIHKVTNLREELLTLKALIDLKAEVEIPDLDANKIVSGKLHKDRIPNLDASKINTGVFRSDQIPELSANKITSGTLDSSLIPNIGIHKVNNLREELLSLRESTGGSGSRARVFATESALDAWLLVPENVALLQIGDNLYIEETGKPDYWWNGTNKVKLETEKVELTEYAKKTELLTLGTTSNDAYRGDLGQTAYNHSQSAHAPANAQKNSDITKAEIEAKLTGPVTTHTHSYNNLDDKPTIPTIPDIELDDDTETSGKYISKIEVDETNKHKLNITKKDLPQGFSGDYSDLRNQPIAATPEEITEGTETTARLITPKLLVDNFSKTTHTHSGYAPIGGVSGNFGIGDDLAVEGRLEVNYISTFHDEVYVNSNFIENRDGHQAVWDNDPRFTIATKAEAEAGENNALIMTPLRVKESILANAPSGEGGGADLSNYYTKNQTDTLLGNKQSALTAGEGISIVDNTISSTNEGYTPDEETITLNENDKLEATNVSIWRYE